MDDNLEILHDRYATALYEIAEQDKSLDRVMQELEVLSELWLCDSNFRTFLTHPFITRQEKKAVIEEIARKKNCCGTILNFLKFLIDSDRESLIHGVFLRYRDIYELQQNKIRVVIESPRSLSESEIKRLKNVLYTKFKRDILLEERINSDLIAGLFIRYRDRIFDNSMRTNLDKLREATV
ncbi:MAG: ATP synthase F1 subunit delta [Candidatus Omnitrophica bacterium]|nr:ATP synthase F1 subunit delta [Candidatus Omnitrophota bacterium]